MVRIISKWVSFPHKRNFRFEHSVRRAKEVEGRKIMYVAMGISGGEEGARNGPSLMPGMSPSIHEWDTV